MENRKNIQEEFKWNLSEIYNSYSEIEKDLSYLQKKLQILKTYKGKLDESATSLFECLELSNSISNIISKIYNYAYLKYDEDITVDFSSKLINKVNNIYQQIKKDTEFILPNILKIPENILNTYLESDVLKKYKRFLITIKNRRENATITKTSNILSEMKEFINIPTSNFELINYLDDEDLSNLEENKSNNSSKKSLKQNLKSSNRAIRKDSFEKIYYCYFKYGRILANTLIFNIKKELFISRLKNFDSTLSSSLSKDGLSENIYSNLIETVKSNIDLFHNYIKLKKSILDVDTLYPYDLYAPLVEFKDINFEYNEGQKILLKSLELLGNDYIEIVNKIITERWIDVYPNKGKVKDSYTRNVKNIHPFILLNYNNSINSLLTFAHEIGHCIHLYLLNNNYNGNITIMSEVIAIVNEILLIKYLLNNKYFYKRRKVFLNYFLDHFATTLFRQTMFAEFEKEIHDKIQNHKILNYNDICDIYRDLYIKYYSPVLKITKEIKFEWTRIPHFYRQFYTYKYPLSFSIAIMLVEILQSDNQELKNKYINFLKEDNLSSFNDIFSKYDININSLNSIQYALNMFGNLLNEFANS